MYVQVQFSDSGLFYKDGFTDFSGKFDYFTVSDKSPAFGRTLKLIFETQDGECTVLDGIVGG